MIVVIVEMRISQMIGELASRHGVCGQTGIGTGLIQSQGIKGGKHSQVGENRRIVFSVAVAVGGDIYYQRNMQHYVR